MAPLLSAPPADVTRPYPPSDPGGGVPARQQEAADRRPGDRLGGDHLRQHDHPPLRLPPDAGRVHPHQPARATGPQTAHRGERAACAADHVWCDAAFRGSNVEASFTLM